MKVLVDTSVWVADFKSRAEHLVSLLEAGLVVGRPHVIVELACGTLPHRRAILTTLADLDAVPLATHEELLALIDRHSLQGRGCGFVDISLLTSALLAHTTRLWTLDKRLEALAAFLNVSHEGPAQN